MGCLKLGKKMAGFFCCRRVPLPASDFDRLKTESMASHDKKISDRRIVDSNAECQVGRNLKSLEDFGQAPAVSPDKKRSERRIVDSDAECNLKPLEDFSPVPAVKLDKKHPKRRILYYSGAVCHIDCNPLVYFVLAAMDKELPVRFKLETGAACHIAGNLNLFVDLEPLETPTDLRLVENGEHVPVGGHGSVMTERLNIPNVGYVPGLPVPVNLISVRQLAQDHELNVTFFHDRCYVRDRSGNVVGFAVLSDGEFMLDYLCIIDEQQLQIISVGKAYANIAAHPYNRSLFYMDSGAGFHVTPSMELLQAYLEHNNPMFPDRFHGRHLVCADGNILAAHGVGNIDTLEIKLEDVLHVPGLAANLVSVGHLLNQLNQHLQGRGEAAVTFTASGFIVHIFGGATHNLLLGNGTRAGDDINILNALQQP